ncbi:Protein CBG05804 [Caenorhabditis briggsae]|uniref:Bestrophin homolog n=1 Tax=Caenorhabditis briggsae TaxID=6238 RepID=A8X1L0_CAEBR|nr:Protein CBG05804 [Caenorhabditis briggsae]CAP26520.2 Protein CBG05804 [Caenorhabditis briggsae]
MTVSYALSVSSARYSAFLRLLRKWKGSVVKAVWAELLVWICLYAMISTIIFWVIPIEYRTALNKEATRLDNLLGILDIKFMLGFFVTIVVDRWKTILQNISFIETVALSVSTIIRGTDDNARLSRRSIIRYLVLSQAMVYRDISMRVRRRFPTMKSLMEAGFIFENELHELEQTETGYNKYWVPINWCNSIVWRMQDQKYIEAPVSTNNVLNIVFLAVRIHFFFTLFTRQYIPTETEEFLWYRCIPLIPATSFFLYLGWMKTGMQIVDQSHAECPILNIDQFSDPKFGPMYPSILLEHPHVLQGSAADVVIPESEKTKMVHVDSKTSVGSTSDKDPISIRRRFRRLSSRLKLGRSESQPHTKTQQSVKSPGGESTHSAFSNLQFVTEENEDQGLDLRIDMESPKKP